MIESITDCVSLELLDKLDEFTERFGSIYALAQATNMNPSTFYKLENDFINADLSVNLSTMAKWALPLNHIPFVLKTKEEIAYFGVDPEDYRGYFQSFLWHHAKGMSVEKLARNLMVCSGVKFTRTPVNSYLNGTAIPTVHRLEVIARFFGHVPEYLVDRATIHI